MLLEASFSFAACTVMHPGSCSSMSSSPSLAELSDDDDDGTGEAGGDVMNTSASRCACSSVNVGLPLGPVSCVEALTAAAIFNLLIGCSKATSAGIS
ncbi:hypothetical protein PF007_g21632 [Phytophthora fragariae]|uniref:Uncharacterized protein n=1 Tax=Phytophthora fragariae TaxID=53985 RepID=A0A6A3QWV0_9STRA|nr:hypothetical protein PF007_g21632 [Phytophthora fragariae]